MLESVRLALTLLLDIIGRKHLFSHYVGIRTIGSYYLPFAFRQVLIYVILIITKVI